MTDGDLLVALRALRDDMLRDAPTLTGAGFFAVQQYAHRLDAIFRRDGSPPEREWDRTCDHDIGRTCRQLWPAHPDSWCAGCLLAEVEDCRAGSPQTDSLELAWLKTPDSGGITPLHRLESHLAGNRTGKTVRVNRQTLDALLAAVRTASAPPQAEQE